MATAAPSGYSKQQFDTKLREGAEAWNEWRRQNPDVPLLLNELNLSNLDLSRANLNGADFRDTILDGTKLQRANLKAANFNKGSLKGVDLSNADLTESDMQVSDLSKATLREAHLRRANLQRVDCKEVDLLNADLREANLQGADLSTVKAGLLPSQLAGADLTGATLPKPLETLYDKMGSVSEISESAKKLFLALLGGCLYSWLTIATTRDVDLITNRASSPLPIIQTAIPIVGFYVVAPIILICIYFYFHFYLQKLWEELAQLPAIFPDGKPLYQRADPWLFNDLVRAHFAKLNKARPFLSHFQKWLSILLAWWLVPFTLSWFWARYLRRHDQPRTYVHAVLLAISIAFAIQLYRLARETLSGVRPKPLTWKRFGDPQTYLDLLRPAVIAIVLILISRAAINGTPQTRIARFMSWIGYPPFADLMDSDVSVKPANWTGKKEEELELVKGANLDGRDLRYANLEHAFLAKADLTKSDLRSADLQGADLRQATFGKPIIETTFATSTRRLIILKNTSTQAAANLENTNLQNALLNGTDLSYTNLANANLYRANMTNAHLQYANLRAAYLSGANLTAADLSGSDLTGAAFDGTYQLRDFPMETPSYTDMKALMNVSSPTTIKYADFRDTKGLTFLSIAFCGDRQLAFFDSDLLWQLSLPPDHNEALAAYRSSGSEEPFGSWQAKWRQGKSKATEKKSK